MRFQLCLVLLLFTAQLINGQQRAVVREYAKAFVTYPFSDPNPIPNYTNTYPYFRFDGFTDQSVKKKWKVIEMENPYIKLTILPEIGGRIWSAVEKTTMKPFLYENNVIKFRDIALRGPWLSGGLEANYGIFGHTANTATPVDYLIRKNRDGSVSCVVSVLDLITRTTWSQEINLPKDKAYFTTRSFWHNSNLTDRPYYHWMNAAIKTEGNLQYIFPGTKHLDHGGKYGDWPVNVDGKDISWYDNNDFGGYKSYHIYGKYSDFFGAYWHDEDFGMARYSEPGEKAGRKIWIWGHSRQGKIWEDLLTDTSGQYTEIQSGRLFNQTEMNSSFTPFKHLAFAPFLTDVWTEYWYPVIRTKGFVVANSYGALNVTFKDGWLKVRLSPVQKIDDYIEIMKKDSILFRKKLALLPLETFVDSIRVESKAAIRVRLDKNKFDYQADSAQSALNRPYQGVHQFDWQSVYGLYLYGKELYNHKLYDLSEAKLQACLKKDPHYLPALVTLGMLMYHNMRYQESLSFLEKALQINIYHGEANYYYGITCAALNNKEDALDALSIASLSVEYRSAAFTVLASLHLKGKNYEQAITFASKALDFNQYNTSALQLKAISYRKLRDRKRSIQILDSIALSDPINHFVRFEKYLWKNNEDFKRRFTTLIQNEQRVESFLELSDYYLSVNCLEESSWVLQLSPKHALVYYRQAYLKHKLGQDFILLLKQGDSASAEYIFPFRASDETLLKWVMEQSDSWKPKYYAAILYKDRNRIEEAKKLFALCGNEPDFAPFYAARAAMHLGVSELDDLMKAIELDPRGWRYTKMATEYYLNHKHHQKALETIEPFYQKDHVNYLMGLLYAKVLLANKRYTDCLRVLKNIVVLPFEGATEGRDLYRQSQLRLAVAEMKNGKYQQALSYIALAREWPENLGAGKPFPDYVDERLEDWLAHLCHTELGKLEVAQSHLTKIISFTPRIENAVKHYLPVNNLLTALAIEKVDSKASARQWLLLQRSRLTEDPSLEWCIEEFDKGLVKGQVTDDEQLTLFFKRF